MTTAPDPGGAPGLGIPLALPLVPFALVVPWPEEESR
jgi:hypothetical protein